MECICVLVMYYTILNPCVNFILKEFFHCNQMLLFFSQETRVVLNSHYVSLAIGRVKTKRRKTTGPIVGESPSSTISFPIRFC